MDFIFMLTHRDVTVPDCLAVIDEIAPLGLGHIGFKDIGADVRTLRALTRRIHDTGATSYLEVVATTPADALNSARMAVELGVRRLLGGTQVAEILKILAGTGIGYFPFPGRPAGHPTRLAGTSAEVEAMSRNFTAMGCAGVDLLAYRATEAKPLDLVAAARRGVGAGRLVCAGGIDNSAKIAALATAGCDAFTVGSAVFDFVFAPNNRTLRRQISEIIACTEQPSA